MKESKVQEVATKELVEVSESTKSKKMSELRHWLREWCNELDAKASNEGREFVKPNDLLREAYGVKEGAKLHTFEGWKRRGGQVKKGEKALLFWGKPRKGEKWCPVVFLFAASQVVFNKEGVAA